MVTANDGTNVGPGPGQVPPVGSVYNVIYTGSADSYFLYSSLPSSSGDVISLLQATPAGIANMASTFIDASKPPTTKPLSAPGGQSFVPISSLQPSGVNGLPPREVQIQGNQQFAVYNSAGDQLGSVNAEVANQWDLFGIQSQALLITDATSGTPGSTPSDVPTVGSQFESVSFGTSGWGISRSDVPAASGQLTAFSLVTPFGNIPLTFAA